MPTAHLRGPSKTGKNPFPEGRRRPTGKRFFHSPARKPADGRPVRRKPRTVLLQLDLGASAFELSLDLLGLVLGHAFLDRLRSALDQVLGFLEAETGDRAHFLDHVDLLGA